ncbi:hypothetical protein SAMN05421754_108311 [Nitrosomonas sp. Nm58]|nr:hypothetical protein SAMN05421754_108311 [Nitrosomonas sp. Nm58]
MTGMLDLRDVFQLIVDSLHDRTFTQQKFVKQRQQLASYVFTQLGDELHAFLPELLKEWLRDVALVTKEFPK